jgi:hypothetical protein
VGDWGEEGEGSREGVEGKGKAGGGLHVVGLVGFAGVAGEGEGIGRAGHAYERKKEDRYCNRKER